MANVARPPLRQTRLTFSPVVAPNDDAHCTTAAHTPNSVSTRRTSRTGPLLALADDAKPVQQLLRTPAATPTPAPAPTRPAPPARITSRKRPAAALSPDATDTRPPTKVTVTQPHGELMRITNGVSAPLGIDADDVSSATSTPRPGSSGRLAVPAPGSTTSQDKRSLRSHDGGSRLKSDLPTYFANYDEVIAGLPQSSELLDYETPIYVVDEPLKPKINPNTPRTSLSPTRSRKARPPSPPRNTSNPSIPPLQSSTTFQVLNYTSIAKAIQHDTPTDPLDDNVFFASHRRAERKEKQLRNIEKERAMHEKVQLERLLDGLQGPDWLKVMGITGVTDGERKDWEPKRDYFVREVEALVDKFRVWKEEEKRLRAEKEAALAAEDEASGEEGDDNDESEDQDSVAVHPRTRDPAHPPRSQPKPPLSPPKPRRPPRPHGFLLPVLPPEPQAPFMSFYAKPHLRAAALGKHRHGGHGRNASAFGQPVPEWEEREFALPQGVLGEDVLRDNARSRRRRKRESGVGGKKE
ncbi:hypothetical protein T440DRAFT_455477 [Plenodomus tracheiphilus IPT5]|uniref:Something about silencing protein 4 domain-containing protein n=1 Tax=Plenodomus tracheiphilus IPT5 TaxID=1408161 RepID=A0A6A7AXI8_9PLEO|nr:hypothetical protein T440DRAFT_455477 [Plenodomus tracheiphilus IPT5]